MTASQENTYPRASAAESAVRMLEDLNGTLAKLWMRLAMVATDFHDLGDNKRASILWTAAQAAEILGGQELSDALTDITEIRRGLDGALR